MIKNPTYIDWNKCDTCGKFISMKDFNSGKAIRTLLSVDSDYSCEEYETLCRKHSRGNKRRK